ncbi:hypothetical protein PVAND_006784 [Polypedilum vanderplanki]|uniref:Nose resistant-to-fluoxetine protein N-terminal domain-containing protein n=1 Tax=Polypedilum vanderplanki TaxID=319348 RepID=A0A9J6C4B5_POLVA|nr:hypothetical protein PVAND_006784 [Polypedilum vanderplanki]
MQQSLKIEIFVIVTFIAIYVRGGNEPLIDILNNFDRTNVSELCSDHLEILQNAIENDEIWAYKVRDVSGKKSFGFAWGNNFWLGGERACLQLNNPPAIYLKPSETRHMMKNAASIKSGIPLAYRMFYIAHSSRIQFDINLFNQSMIHIGLCFPKVCTDLDADEFGNKIIVPVTVNDRDIYGRISYEKSRTLNVRENFLNDTFVKIMIYTILTFGILVTLGTFYTALTRNMKEVNGFILNNISNLSNNENIITKNLDLTSKLKHTTIKTKKLVADRFWFCFSLQKNYKFIMSPNLGKDSLPVIHGMRTIGIFWIIIGHIYYYAIASIDNLQLAFSYAESLTLQPIFAAAISVDSFYTISGLLLAYGFCEKQKKRPSRNLVVDVLKGVFYRYIRIAPCFMILMLFAVSMSMCLNDTSQFLTVENIEVNCKNHWWRNLFFIQNLYPLSEMCLSWSWYVSTDFQLFIISSIILAISARNFKLSVILTLIIAVTCSIYSGHIGLQQSFGFSLDNQYRSIDELYTKPYTRAAQYLAGTWTGFYLSKINRQWGIRKIYINLGWALSIVTLLSLVFVQIYKETNFVVSFMFPAVGRIFWSLAICFMVVAGSTEYSDGFIAKILSSKLLLPFSRMSFSAYLFNPLVVMFLALSCEVPFHLDFYSMPIYILGFYFITYFAAFLFMLLFENPIIMFVRAYTK